MKLILATVAIVALATPATAYQTEVDPQTMQQKRAAKVRWDERQQRAARAAARAAAAAAEDTAAASDASTEYGEVGASTSTGVSVSVDWDAIAECESGGDWHINTGNGYFGGLQFHPDTWTGAGGAYWSGFDGPCCPAFPFSREEQIAVASNLSLSHWPHCGAYG